MYRRNTPKAENRGSDPPGGDSSLLLPRTKRTPSPPLRRNSGKLSSGLCNNVWKAAANFAQVRCHDFLHARTGVKGCRLAGIIRVCYASLYLYSIFLMTLQMPTLFDPRKGLIPYSITGEFVDDYAYSVFEYAPQSSLLMYAMFLLGLSSGVLLLLGIEPRWGAAGCFFFLHNLRSHNALIWDHEFHMNRMWAFFLIFLPLDHITIRDGFGGLYPLVRKLLKLPPNRCQGQQEQQQVLNLSTSWAMWPFRFWQVYTCLIYMGAALGKFNSRTWIRGDALSWCWYDEGLGRFYPEFVTEFLYNRMIPIKIQTWLSLAIEMLCFITIWPLKTRKFTFIAIVILHIGIELALVMHIFEYLSVLGWVCFFAYPNDGEFNSGSVVHDKKSDATPTIAPRSWRPKKIAETIFAVSILYLLVFNTYPSGMVEKIMPAPITYLVSKFVKPSFRAHETLEMILQLTGLYSDPYLLFRGMPPHEQVRITGVIRFNDGKDPVLFLEDDWVETSRVEREIDYWYDTYEYYLLEDDHDGADYNPFFTTFSVHLAELYGNGNIDREYEQITINSGNDVESVSIQIHRRSGSDTPPSPDLGGFEPIPREWTYSSECRYVFRPGAEQKRILEMESLWDFDEDEELDVRNGCANYNKADEALHRKGQYGEPSKVDDDNGNDDGNGKNDDEKSGDSQDGSEDGEQEERSDDGEGQDERLGREQRGEADDDKAENGEGGGNDDGNDDGDENGRREDEGENGGDNGEKDGSDGDKEEQEQRGGADDDKAEQEEERGGDDVGNGEQVPLLRRRLRLIPA